VSCPVRGGEPVVEALNAPKADEALRSDAGEGKMRR